MKSFSTSRELCSIKVSDDADNSIAGDYKTYSRLTYRRRAAVKI